MVTNTINVPQDAEFYESEFGIDDGDILPYLRGYSQGDRWNGWACPYFEFENAKKILELVTEGGGYWEYDKATDIFRALPHMADFEESWKGLDIDVNGETKHVYAIGAYFWTWQDKSWYKPRN